MSEDSGVGFQNYEWKDADGNVWPISLDRWRELNGEGGRLFCINTDNIKYMQREVRPTPWHRKMMNRIKGAWSLLLRGDDYYE